MNSPPVQTPALFLKGGGTKIFSADCVQKLLAAGYDPEWFGSHDHVQGKIRGAKKRVADQKAWAEGKLSKQPEPLRPGDEYLAKCQAGHISQDATHRESGGRGNACSNLQYGYDTAKAPCMPQMGEAWDPPGGEHNVASRHEVACANRDRKKNEQSPDPVNPSKLPYDPDLREQDEKERLKHVMSPDRRPDEREPLSPKPASSTGAKVAAGSTPASAEGASGKDATEPSIPEDDKIKGEDAADCVNNFKKAAMQAMRSHVTQDRINKQAENRTDANGGPKQPGQSDEEYAQQGAKYRKGLEDKAQAAKIDADATEKERIRIAQQFGAASTNAQRARKAADAAPDNPVLQGKAREQGEKAQEMQDALARAETREKWVRGEADAHQRAADSANAAHCEAEEGAKLSQMTPEQRKAACVNPGMNKPSDTGSAARVSGLHPEAKAGFTRTQAEDPKGTISA